MKTMPSLGLLLCVLLTACGGREPPQAESTRAVAVPLGQTATTPEQVRQTAPALENYTRTKLSEGVWKRPGLSPRDRSLVTVAALVTRNDVVELPYHFTRALDNGVKPSELSELVTHLAFYTGWGNATSAVGILHAVYLERGVTLDQLPEINPTLLPMDEAAEARRDARVGADVGPVSQGIVEYTNDILFHDLWLRPALAPRDRSLITVSALVASGQVAQAPYHLNRAMDNGLTQLEASEMLTQLAFYSGWPSVFSAVPVFKSVFESRAAPAG